MKLRATMTMDGDFPGFLEVAEWQKKIDALKATLTKGGDFKNVQYKIKVRRDHEPDTAIKRGPRHKSLR